MSDDLFCDPCQRFLSGENPSLYQENGELNFVHHSTAESFRQALELPCSICRRLRREISQQRRIVDPDLLDVCKWLTRHRPRIRIYIRSGTDRLPFNIITQAFRDRITYRGRYCRRRISCSFHVLCFNDLAHFDAQGNKRTTSLSPSGSLWCCSGG